MSLHLRIGAIVVGLLVLAGCGTRTTNDDVLDPRLVGQWRVVQQAYGVENIGAIVRLDEDGGYQVNALMTGILNYFSAGTWRVEPEQARIVLVDRGTVGRALRYRDERTLVRSIARYRIEPSGRLRLDFITIRNMPAIENVFLVLERTGAR